MLNILFFIVNGQSPERGHGITIRFGSALHLNLTGALLRALNDTLRMILSANDSADNNESTAAEVCDVYL